MYDTYQDACEATLTQEQVKRELKKHFTSWEDFVADVNEKTEYLGQEVLDWLGY